jgi:curved DNA-binding protein CbpA
MNHFERLGFSPRPWIDAGGLKDKFLQLSAQAHPDKASASDKDSSEKRFQELNASYNVLRNTRARLLHLLELSGAAKQEHVQEVPPAALELFPEVAAATKRADGLIKEKAAANSPMLRVQFMERGLEEVERLQELQGRIREKINAIENSLKDLNASWSSAPTDAVLKAASEAAAALGFFERWNAQLQERIGALTF